MVRTGAVFTVVHALFAVLCRFLLVERPRNKDTRRVDHPRRHHVYPGGISMREMLWRAHWLLLVMALGTVYIFTTGVR